jgi:hypothetical protein
MWRAAPVYYGTFIIWSADNKLLDREIEKKNQIDSVLDYIHRQLSQLKVVNDLPDSCVPPTALINRAVDVKSCALEYVAVHIRHESGLLGTLGIHLFDLLTTRECGYSVA